MTDRRSTSLPSGSGPEDQESVRALSRSHCYGLLALVLRGPPTEQIVEQLRSPPLAEVLGELGCDVAGNFAGELGAVTQRLAEDYTRLFVGPGPHVSPYASVNDDREGQLWGESTARVKRFIEQTGLSFEGDWDSIPDHIAIELEFMQRLTAHEADLCAQRTGGPKSNQQEIDRQLHRCRQIQHQFLHEHLSRWVPQFCDHILKLTNASFYREMAKLIQALIACDLQQTAAQEAS
ncbi:hypothetical protein LCGC14_0015250 [marine sediment metagenome]|uniref:Chaperone protein TorD n=1 Tax=marine sediment metagenome TaxID=412755 RepID=A0A0F9W3W1_9ZZZZ